MQVDQQGARAGRTAAPTHLQVKHYASDAHHNCHACRYIYNHKACGRCGTSVRTWDMSARTCYACEVCQPLQQGTILDAKRTKALSAAKNSKVSVLLSLPFTASRCSKSVARGT